MKITKQVLCCNECESPLRAMPDGGHYCDKCDYAPCLEDVVFTHLCPSCGQKTKKWHGLKKCENCNEVFEK